MKPLRYDSNPFKNVLECLQTEGSVQAHQRQNKIEKALVVDEERMCSSIFEDGQMAETFADWVAYEVLAHSFEKNQKGNLKQKVFESDVEVA